MVAAVGPGGGDTGARFLLARAQGYAVLDVDGRRVGRFIELTAPSEGRSERAAIRHDGIFLWRRRLLPLEAIEKVIPERRLVVLALKRQAVDSAGELFSERDESAGHDGRSADWVATRIKHYALPSGGDDDRANTARERAAAPLGDGAEETTRPADGDRDRPRNAPSPMRRAESHLLFVPTTDGYFLAERDGPPPPLACAVEAPELPGSFSVAKLAPSPLPEDRRTCAYLERLQ